MQIKYMFYLIALIVIIGFIIKFISREKYPYEKIESIVTNTEKNFLGVLLESVNSDIYVLTKVRLADIVRVKKGVKKYIKYFSRIQSKHIDFVLCDVDTFEPLLAIELDDASHLREDAKERDEIKNKVLEAAGIPLLRIKPQKRYNSKELESVINEML